jgi:hypothetical protein
MSKAPYAIINNPINRQEIDTNLNIALFLNCFLTNDGNTSQINNPRIIFKIPLIKCFQKKKSSENRMDVRSFSWLVIRLK